jgi:hypothetical protein
MDRRAAVAAENLKKRINQKIPFPERINWKLRLGIALAKHLFLNKLNGHFILAFYTSRSFDFFLNFQYIPT